MGRQVVVSVAALKTAGIEAIKHPVEGYYGERQFDYESNEWYPGWGTKEFVGVVIGGRKIVGDSTESLVFDCKNEDSGNYWVLEHLRLAGVEYYWG